MLKKLLTAALVASLLILPVSSTGPVVSGKASSPAQTQDYLPGDVPAQTDAAETMSPALHALVLALLNHDADRFDFDDAALTWEALYNMLSLYGQLDDRSVTEDGTLLLPEETLLDYAAALACDLTPGTPPAAVRDRLSYDKAAGYYTVVCGEDGLAQVQVDRVTPFAEGCALTGALVYQVDGQVLARFQARLLSQDNMFGYVVKELRITG